MALCYSDKKSKYGHPELEDQQVENLAKYFRIEGYPNLWLFLRQLRPRMNQNPDTSENESDF